MYQTSTSQNNSGIEKQTPKNLAIAIILGDDVIKKGDININSKQYYKILYIQFIIEKLIIGFHNCTELQHGLTIKFKIHRSTQFVNGLLNQVMKFYQYNNGTNYCVEKYHLLLDKIRKDQARLNDKYDVEIKKHEKYNKYFLVYEDNEVLPKTQLKLVPQLITTPQTIIQKPAINNVTPISQSIPLSKINNSSSNIKCDQPNYIYFDYLFQNVKQTKQIETIEFLFPLLNQYLSYALDDLLGTLENFEETTLLQFTIIDSNLQYKCICQLLIILSD